MRRKFAGSIFLLAVTLTVLPLEAAVTGLISQESSQELLVKAPSYSLRIHKSPFSFELLAGDKVVAKSANSGVHFMVRQGKQYQLTSLERWSCSGGILQVTAATTLPGVAAHMDFAFFPDHLTIQIKSSDGQMNDELGENFLLNSGGHWYGGNITSTQQWPLETGSLAIDPFYSTSNQTSPIWLTSSGTAIFVPTYHLMGFSLNRDKDGLFSFHLNRCREVLYHLCVGRNIVEAFTAMTSLAGKPRQVPPRDYFAEPIFNSWIEFHTEVTQVGLEKYVENISKNGFPCKIVEIDDKWAPKHGDFVFDSKKFPDPKKMIARFHEQGLRLILWATPFFEAAAANYRTGLERQYFIMNEKGIDPYITEWWNGKAALVDFSNPEAYQWYLGMLQNLQREYGVDGYKLDGGDGEYLAKPFTSQGRISSLRYTDLFASIGQYFDINELRVSWLVQPLGLLQRLRDKDPTWSRDDGLNALLPHGLSEGLIGYPFFCPDMIGGGLDSGYFGATAKGIDAELFVRWTEASALLPMMQYSYAPWRMEEKYVAICRKYSLLHKELGDYIYSLALDSIQSGLPMARPLFFRNPEDEKCYFISDQFMLGEKFLVAPVLSQGAASRDIYLPSGTWIDYWNGRVYQGGQTLKSYPAPLEVLPIFVNVH